MLAQFGTSVHNHGGALNRLVNIHCHQANAVSCLPSVQIRTAKLCLNEGLGRRGESTHLVCITRDRSYTFNSEVKQFCREPCLLEEWYDETTEAAINMEANVVLLGNRSESNDVVHRTIWEVDSGSNDLGRV